MKTKYGELRDYSYEDMLFGLTEETKVYSLEQSQNTLLPWCPLFGELPYNSLSDTCQIGKAIDIIHDARSLWEINSRVYTLGLDNLIDSDSWAEVEDLQPFYPKDKLLLARNLFIEWDHIRGQTVKYRKRPYKYEDRSTPRGKIKIPVYMSEELSQTPKDAIIHWFKRLSYEARFEKLEAWQIFSILSIYEARKVINISLYSGVASCYYNKAKWFLIEEWDNSIEITKQVQKATALLQRAYGLKASAGLEKARETHKKNLKGNKDDEWADWQKKADVLWAKNPRLSKVAVAEWVRKQLKQGGDYPPSKHTIRVRIKKTT